MVLNSSKGTQLFSPEGGPWKPLFFRTSTKQQGQITPFRPETSSLLFLLWGYKCHLWKLSIGWPISMQLWVKIAFLIMVGSKLCITIMSHFDSLQAPWTKILKNSIIRMNKEACHLWPENKQQIKRKANWKWKAYKMFGIFAKSSVQLICDIWL